MRKTSSGFKAKAISDAADVKVPITRFHESQNLQFRVEVFNLLDRANFNTPNLITHVLQPGSTTPTQSPAAGLITSTSTSSRQIQFGLKWLW